MAPTDRPGGQELWIRIERGPRPHVADAPPAAHFFSGLAIIVPMAVFQFGNGLVMPNTVAGAIAPFPRAAGAVSALAGFVQTGTGALSGVVRGRLHDGSARPMALLIGVSTVAAALMFKLMVPHHGRHEGTRWKSRV
jgi:hypothetical protein